MYGNNRLPGMEASGQYRYEGSIWRGSPESTWFKVVKVSGEIQQGSIVKEDSATGVYSPITADDIIAAASSLPGVRLGIVADKKPEESALIGISGQVDRNKLYVGDVLFTDESLTDVQRNNLNTQLEAWGFQLIDVKER